MDESDTLLTHYSSSTTEIIMSASHPPASEILPVTRVAEGIFENGMAVAHFRGTPAIFGVDAGVIFVGFRWFPLVFFHLLRRLYLIGLTL